MNYSETLEILIRNNLISLPITQSGNASLPIFVTILNNISYYGYALTQEVYDQLENCSDQEIIQWWQKVEPIFSKITGDDKKMADFVVYKNFPQEVLQMSEAEYWFKQILMYWGFPNQYFTESEKERPKLEDKINFRVLHLAKEDSLKQIFLNLLYLPNRWIQQQWDDLVTLIPEFKAEVQTDKIQFKENLVKLLVLFLEQEYPIQVNSATDVLRLAAGLSKGDISLRIPRKFKKFKRQERRFLLELLNNSKNLEEDITRRRNVWKKLMYALHPGDYRHKYPLVVAAYDKLYKDSPIITFNNQLESLLAEKNKQALELLKT